MVEFIDFNVCTSEFYFLKLIQSIMLLLQSNNKWNLNLTTFPFSRFWIKILNSD